MEELVGANRCGYSEEHSCAEAGPAAPCKLVADQVDLGAEAGTCAAMDLVSEELRAKVSDPEILFLPTTGRRSASHTSREDPERST